MYAFDIFTVTKIIPHNIFYQRSILAEQSHSKPNSVLTSVTDMKINLEFEKVAQSIILIATYHCPKLKL